MPTGQPAPVDTTHSSPRRTSTHFSIAAPRRSWCLPARRWVSASCPSSPEYGLLTGKYHRDQAPPEGSRLALDSQAERLAGADWDEIERLSAFAQQRDLTMLQVAIGGLAAQPAVSSVIAGVTSADQVRSNAAAGLWEPSAEDLAEL